MFWLKKRIDSLKKEISDLEEDKAMLEEKISYFKNVADLATNEYGEEIRKLANVKKDADRLETEIASKNEIVLEQQDRLNEIILKYCSILEKISAVQKCGVDE